MPGLFASKLSRKEFLLASGAAATSLLAESSILAITGSEQQAHLALLSDTHTPADPANGYRGFAPVDNLKRIVPQIISAKPQAALINGDAARLVGKKADYRVLKTLLEPLANTAPIHIGLGNHDHRENFFEIFPPESTDQPLVENKHVSTFVLGGTRFVILDSLLYVDKVAGLLGNAQRAWLAKFLETTDETPIVFFVHHTLGDGDGDLLDFDRVFGLMKPHRKVKAIFYGHSHRYHVEQREHIFLINQPAVGYNFNDDQPVGWLDAYFSPTNVRMKLHAIGGNATDDGKEQSVAWA